MIRDRSLVALLAAEFVSVGHVVAGTIFALVGLHPAYAVMAALGTFATFNFILAAAPLWEGTVAEETA